VIPWTIPLDGKEARYLAGFLHTACLITTAMITGMRGGEKRAELQQMQHSARSINGVSAGRMGVRRGCRNVIGGSASTACARLASPQQCCI